MQIFSGKTKGFIQLIFVLAFIFASFAISSILKSTKPEAQNKAQQDRAIFVETQKVELGSHRIAFSTTGVVEALTDIDIVPQVNGQVINVNPNFYAGGRFAKDEVLFEIDPRDFELEVERLDAEVARARTDLSLEQAESKAALSEWRQLKGDKKAPDLVARIPQLQEAKASLRAAQAQLQNAELDLERTKFSLPFDGLVMNSSIAKGRYVGAGQSFGQVFDVNTLEVRASMEGQNLEWLLDEESIDVQVTVRYRGTTKSYEGFLKRGTAALDVTTRFAKVSFGLRDAVDLLPGVFATIDIQGPSLQNIITIPMSALQKGNIVWAIGDDDRLVELTPDIVYTNDDFVIVRGIENNADIVVGKLEGGAAGMKVKRSASDNDDVSPATNNALGQ